MDIKAIEGNSSNLNELISLAEKSSETIMIYRMKIRKFKHSIVYLISATFILVFGLSYISSQNSEFFHKADLYIGILVLLYCSFVLMFSYNSYSNYVIAKRELNKEGQILQKLLNMINDLKDYIFKEEKIGRIEQTIVEMRLQRISFSVPNHNEF